MSKERKRALRAKTFKRWLHANLSATERRDLAEHGAAGGFAGLIYYHETSALFDKYRDEIWEVLAQIADAVIGRPSPVHLIAHITHSVTLNPWSTFANLCVWTVAEHYCETELNEKEQQ